VSTEQSLAAEPEPRIPTAISGLETFSLTGSSEESEDTERESTVVDAESLFNLPGKSDDGEDEDGDDTEGEGGGRS
jgi:hypothetical protein